MESTPIAPGGGATITRICCSNPLICHFFFFNDTATTEIYTLSLTRRSSDLRGNLPADAGGWLRGHLARPAQTRSIACEADRKSTRLNSSHSQISYAVFCLKKKNAITNRRSTTI